MALAPHCSQTRKPKLNWHKALVRDDSANQHGAWIPTYICLPRAQTGSTVSRCPQRRKLRPREGVWDSSPGAASISCTKIICRHREGSRSCSCPDTVWDPVLQLPAPTPGNEAVGHRPRGLLNIFQISVKTTCSKQRLLTLIQLRSPCFVDIWQCCAFWSSRKASLQRGACCFSLVPPAPPPL